MDSVSDDNPGETAAISVFLSYSSEDRERARHVVAALEANGCSVWWDRLLGGATPSPGKSRPD